MLKGDKCTLGTYFYIISFEDYIFITILKDIIEKLIYQYYTTIIMRHCSVDLIS